MWMYRNVKCGWNLSIISHVKHFVDPSAVAFPILRNLSGKSLKEAKSDYRYLSILPILGHESFSLHGAQPNHKRSTICHKFTNRTFLTKLFHLTYCLDIVFLPYTSAFIEPSSWSFMLKAWGKKASPSRQSETGVKPIWNSWVINMSYVLIFLPL